MMINSMNTYLYVQISSVSFHAAASYFILSMCCSCAEESTCRHEGMHIARLVGQSERRMSNKYNEVTFAVRREGVKNKNKQREKLNIPVWADCFLRARHSFEH